MAVRLNYRNHAAEGNFRRILVELRKAEKWGMEENKGFKYNQGKRGTGANNKGDQGKTKGQKAQWGHLVTKNRNNPGQILTESPPP